VSSILIIDDEYTVIEPLIVLLESENFKITWAKNGKEALEFIKRESFDWICTDIVMPDMDGLELLHQLRSVNRTFRCIAWSGATFIDTYLKVAKHLGAEKVLSKPFLPDDVLEIIQGTSCKS
jgi:YesN/AraC family two-component response regulator